MPVGRPLFEETLLMMQRSWLGRGLWLATVLAVISGVQARVGESRPRTGYPEDWTHHHVMFPDQLLREHPEIAARDPRALHQIYRRWIRSAALQNAVVTNQANKSSGDWNVTLGNGTVTFGQAPAKYSFDPNATPSCTGDYVVFGVNAAGATGGQATLVAFNQLYAGALGMGGMCPGGPVFQFAYNTTTLTNGRIRTSPVISLDGKKIAFIESSTTGSALHVLTWGTTGNNGMSSINSAAPGSPTNNATMVSISYTTNNNTRSSPWVDYQSDSLYVSDNGGKIYKFTGVFKGSPALVSTGGWPVTITGGGTMSSPVLDSQTGNIFVGDAAGFLHSFNATTPGTVLNLAIGKKGNLNAAIVDAPSLDGYGNVFATSSNDGTSAVVVEASTVGLTELARVRVGQGSLSGTAVNVYDGSFDNNYGLSQNSGHLLVCGTGSAAVGISPFLYNMAFSGGIVQTDSAPVQLSTSTTARCSPITEFFNPNIGGGTDFLFWGVSNNCGIAGSPATGCLMSRANGVAQTPVVENGGTSATIIDNDIGPQTNQTSSVYFATEAGGFRAIKVTQLGLQ
jgi:hypothetical protein